MQIVNDGPIVQALDSAEQVVHRQFGQPGELQPRLIRGKAPPGLGRPGHVHNPAPRDHRDGLGSRMQLQRQVQ